MIRLAVLALALAFALPEVQSEPMEENVLRILTFNIKHGATMNGDFDLDVIAKVIQDARPDFVALQEVDVKTRRARGIDLAAALADRTGMAAAFGKAMDYSGGQYGNAILSRHGIEASESVALPFTPENEPRAAIAADIALPGGQSIRFISTHLEVASENARLAQARAINERFGRDKTPAILAGDFNAQPGSAAMAELAKSWTIACGDNPAPTFPSSNPDIKIDYVLFRPAGRWTVQETRVIQDKVASDHCAYLVVLSPGKD